MLRRRPLLLFACLVAVVAAAGGGIYYQQHYFRHFAVHEPGMVYRSAFLSQSAFAKLIETYQIRSVVNLCNPDEMTPAIWEGERQAVASQGATLYTVPLPNSVTIDADAWEPHLRIMNNPDNYPMLVHCQHGVTRTAMFLAAYDVIHRNMTAADSLAVQPMFGHTHANVHVQAFGKNLDQFVRDNRSKLAAQPLGILR